jgi:hypothetical protein
MMLQTANYFTQNALKLAYEHLEHEKFFQGASPPGPPRKREEGRGEGTRHKILPQGKAIEVTPLLLPLLRNKTLMNSDG